MNIVGFAFKKNISEKVLQKLNLDRKFFIDSDKDKINLFVQELYLLKPHYILGLGKYSGVDKDKLRIETHYSKDKVRKPINYYLTPSEQTNFANGIGNSYCNCVSQKIMETGNVEYTFIHIPKKFNEDLAIHEIENMLLDSRPPWRETGLRGNDN